MKSLSKFKIEENTSPVIKQLDDSLKFLAKDHKRYVTHDILKKEVFNNSPEIDVEAIEVKLRDDNMIHYGRGTDNYTEFKISVNGEVFLAADGYHGDILRQMQTELSITNQHRQTTALTKLTWWIAGGTVIAGIYYLIEILKYFHVIPQNFVCF